MPAAAGHGRGAGAPQHVLAAASLPCTTALPLLPARQASCRAHPAALPCPRAHWDAPLLFICGMPLPPTAAAAAAAAAATRR